MNKINVEKLREEYKKGTRIRLVQMDDRLRLLEQKERYRMSMMPDPSWLSGIMDLR